MKAHLPFQDAHLNYQKLKLGLTGNSKKGARPFSSDRNHLFKVAHAIISTVCNQQSPSGSGGQSMAGRSAPHTGPTWYPAVRAIARRTRPLATDSPQQHLGLELAPPTPARAEPGYSPAGAPEGGGVQRRRAACAGGEAVPI